MALLRSTQIGTVESNLSANTVAEHNTRITARGGHLFYGSPIKGLKKDDVQNTSAYQDKLTAYYAARTELGIT